MEFALTEVRKFLEQQPVTASAPCRIDIGGTLDIPTLSFPLRRLCPRTVNVALNLRTSIHLSAGGLRRVRVDSTGFAPAEFSPSEAPYDHPLGLIFAAADHFGLAGVDIRINSASPVRSALGGSSVALVALVGALARVAHRLGGRKRSLSEVAMLAQGLEAAVAGVPCGFQDQLAAAFGGVNAWHWRADDAAGVFRREPLLSAEDAAGLGPHLAVAYMGVPHASKDINGQWVSRFLAGRDRKRWVEIVEIVRRFSTCLTRKAYGEAARLMNRETEIRLAMTPEVLDSLGRRLAADAVDLGCGARFAGAGGGGCIWAIGESAPVEALRRRWHKLLAERDGARLLDVGVDSSGLLCQL